MHTNDFYLGLSCILVALIVKKESEIMEQFTTKIELPPELSKAIKAAVVNAINEAKDTSTNVPTYMSKKQAAKYLGVAPNTLDMWIRDGEDVPYKQIGRTYRFNRNDLDKFMATK
ncbi:excisionase family DNA-binding protein [Limosilactobacillus sp.]|uniref:excisionase family DNA-binding protein n=1 Tax=Limosilactobacillus sp. TaxID=2773925 RepID=UPI00345EE272